MKRRKKKVVDPAHPSLAVLVKLGSLAVHAEEFISPKAHFLDLQAMRDLVADKELQDWIKAMGCLLPVKR